MVGSVIGLQQVIITLVFLASLVGILIFLKMKGGVIRRTLHHNKRMAILEDTALSPTERMRLVAIDAQEFVIVSAKGASPVMMPIGHRSGVGAGEQSSSADEKHAAPEVSSVSPLVLTETYEQTAAQPSAIRPSEAAETMPETADAAVQLKAFREKFESWRQS